MTIQELMAHNQAQPYTEAELRVAHRVAVIVCYIQCGWQPTFTARGYLKAPKYDALTLDVFGDQQGG